MKSSNISCYKHSMLCLPSMQQQQAEYRKIQKKTNGETLFVSLPFRFCEAIPLRKNDTVRMTLSKDKSIVVQRATD